MKIVLSIFLSFCFLFQHISQTIIVLNFELNREYIAKNLCVEKAEPESCCKGSCHLKTKLEEDGKRNENVPGSSSKQKFEKSEYYANTQHSKLDERSLKNNYSSYPSAIFTGHSNGIFRPPCC